MEIKQLTNARVQNFKKMEKRRVVFALGVVYGTAKEKIKQIPKLIEEVINQTDLAEFDRSNFSEYGDFSLNFESVFYVDSPDYNTYMNVKELVFQSIYQRFEAEKIEFAYPTQTVYLEKEQKA